MDESVAALDLPEGVEPEVSSFDFNAAPVVIASISSDSASLTELGEIARREVVPELESIAGVANVEVSGGLTDQVTITLEPVALAQTGINYQQIAAALAAANVTSRPVS